MRTTVPTPMIRGLLAACAAVLLLSGAATLAADDSSKHFEIKAKPLADALMEFGVQSGLTVAVPTTLTAGKRSAPVRGDLSPTDALGQLLKGSGLTFARAADGTIAIQAASGGSSSSPVRMSAVESSSENDSTSSPHLADIIVTATKREQAVEDVPASISVITAEDIEKRGLVSAEDYLRGVPGVNQVSSSVGQSIIIRGIETSPSFQAFYAGNTTATYFGETPTTYAAGPATDTNIDVKLADIERVEVLRGPQGTTFGDASLGGAVRTIPVAPKLDRFEGSIGAGYSVTSGTGGDNNQIQAVGNAPLIDGVLAIRATAYRFDDAGYYRNVAGSDPAFLARAASYLGAQALAVDENRVGTRHFTGGRVAALYQATDKLKFTLTYLTQRIEENGIPVSTGPGYNQTLLEVGPRHVVRGQVGGLTDNDLHFINGVAEYELGWANLLATYSRIVGGALLAGPGNIASAEPYSGLSSSTHGQHVSEVRLVSHLDGRWNFLAGIYAEQQNDTYATDRTWDAPGAGDIFFPGVTALGDYYAQRIEKQQAGFGEVSWEFVPKLTLTGGIRAYHYDRVSATETTGALFGTSSGSVDGGASGRLYRGNLSYKIGEGLVYAQFSQGFRLGRPQPGLPDSLCDLNHNGLVTGTNATIASTSIVDSDSVNNYEIGAKASLLDHRVTFDTALYRIDWTNIPVTVVAPAPPQGCGLAWTTNAGTARSDGFEFQTNFQLMKTLRLDMGGSVIDAKLTHDVPAQGFHAGARLPGTPKVNGNLGLQYDFHVAGHSAFLRADTTYIGTFYGNLRESPNTKSGGYEKVDLSSRITVKGLDIDLFVSNLTNNDAFTFRDTVNYTGTLGQFYGYRLQPRTIGTRVNFRF
jgi:iron complex outermembrane receptor protein